MSPDTTGLVEELLCLKTIIRSHRSGVHYHRKLFSFLTHAMSYWYQRGQAQTQRHLSTTSIQSQWLEEQCLLWGMDRVSGACSYFTNGEVLIAGDINIHLDVAPLLSRQLTGRPHASWYTQALHEAKQRRRQCERKWKSTGLEIHRQIYTEQCSVYGKLLVETGWQYYHSRLTSGDKDPKTVTG